MTSWTKNRARFGGEDVGGSRFRSGGGMAEPEVSAELVEAPEAFGRGGPISDGTPAADG